MNCVSLTSIFIAMLILLSNVHASGPRYEGSGNCSAAPCVSHKEFCGTTNMCYPYSCSNWYKYGPPEYTGHDGNSAIVVDKNLWESEELRSDTIYANDLSRNSIAKLSCREEDMQEDMPEYLETAGLMTVAVVYGCTRMVSLPDPVHGMALYQNFTRSCHTTNGDNHFSCYEMSLNTDYTAFRKDAETAKKQNMIDCSNYNTTAKFIYQVFVFLKNMKYIGGVHTGSSSEEFDENLAQTSMYSFLETIKRDEGSSAPATTTAVSSLLNQWIFIGFSAIQVIFMS